MAFELGAGTAYAIAGTPDDLFGYRQQIYGQYAMRAPNAAGIVASEAVGQALGFVQGAPGYTMPFDLYTGETGTKCFARPELWLWRACPFQRHMGVCFES